MRAVLCWVITDNSDSTGYSTFLPTIIRGLGTWTAQEVQLLTIPCYFIGAAMYMAVAYLSDRIQKRGMFCVLFGTVSLVGYAMLISPTPAGVHYFGYVVCLEKKNFFQLLTMGQLLPHRCGSLYCRRFTPSLAAQ